MQVGVSLAAHPCPRLGPGGGAHPGIPSGLPTGSGGSAPRGWEANLWKLLMVCEHPSTRAPGWEGSPGRGVQELPGRGHLPTGAEECLRPVSPPPDLQAFPAAPTKVPTAPCLPLLPGVSAAGPPSLRWGQVRLACTEAAPRAAPQGALQSPHCTPRLEGPPEFYPETQRPSICTPRNPKPLRWHPKKLWVPQAALHENPGPTLPSGLHPKNPLSPQDCFQLFCE